MVEVNGRSLALKNEDDADEVLANELRHGVALLLQRHLEPAQASASSMAPQACEREDPWSTFDPWTQAAQASQASKASQAQEQSHVKLEPDPKSKNDQPKEQADTVFENDPWAQTSKPVAAPNAQRQNAEEAPPPRSLAGLLNSLFGAPDGPAASQPNIDGESESTAQKGSPGAWSSPKDPKVDDEDTEVEIVAPAWPEETKQDPVHEDAEDEEEVMVFKGNASPTEAAADTDVVADGHQELDPDSDPTVLPRPSNLPASRLQDAVQLEDTANGHLAAKPSSDKDSKAVAAAPVVRPNCSVRCKVPDLEEWLQELRLEEYVVAAAKWCSEMGAVALEEIAENIEDFSADISLKPIERQRVQKWAQKLQGFQGIPPLQVRTLPPQEPSRPSRAIVRTNASTQQSLTGLWNDAPDWDDGLTNPWSQGAVAGSSRETPVYTARSVRLAVDSQGNTGLDLRFDEDWGIRVQTVDPLPGQPGLAEGDFIVAIDGCSLRHRSHEECDQAFAERLQNGAILSVVRCAAPQAQTSVLAPSAGYSRKTDLVPNWRLPRPDFRNSPAWSRPRRGGHDANRMWNRFPRGPPW